MGIEKSELKRVILKNMGIESEERAESLERDVFRAQGGASAFKQAREKIESEIFAKLKRELDENKLTPEDAKHVDRYLRSCLNLMAHLHKMVAEQVPKLAGKAEEARHQVGVLQKQIEEEEAKIATVQEAQQAGDAETGEDGEIEASPGGDPVHGRPVGVRPTSLKDQRLAEADGGSEEADVHTG